MISQKMVLVYNMAAYKKWHFGVFIVITLILGWFSFQYSLKNLYAEYGKLFEYRRLSPDFLPNQKVITLSSAGHVTTYADIIWMNLVQLIGDNIGNDKYHTFVHPIIETITDLHPHFISAYNLSLLLAPEIREDDTSESKKELNRLALKIGETGIKKNCDQQKIEKIREKDFENSLWNDISLRNPCEDGMLPYYTAYVANELKERDKASSYYKIASMNDDAPLASRFLGPLIRAQEGDHKKAAERFLLIAIEGYDSDPYICRNTALSLLKALKNNALDEIIKTLRKQEESLPEKQDDLNTIAAGETSCHNSIIRAMKQLYLAHINEVSKNYPEIRTGEELIKKGVISSYGTIKEQD
jgi:hypothetical protein